MASRQKEEVHERIQELERELQELRRRAGDITGGRRPARSVLRGGAVALAAALAAVFAAGYIPRHRRETEVVKEAAEHNGALPVVRVTAVRRSPAESQFRLPGTIQAITETPVLARADGYLKRRHVDIGDRVSAGQLLAEIEAPELDQQARQAGASLEQAKAGLEQAQANYDQARSNEELAQITATRWANLLKRGVVSRQDNDQQQANLKARSAGLAAASKALDAAKSNIAAAEANLARIEELRRYLSVRAPFAGVVTLRNVDTGALVTSGNTLLFRIAQTGVLRTYINVPQVYASAVRAGMPAVLTLADRPGVEYAGKVTRAANALDPATRTMLLEVQVANRDGSLLPGMYVQVRLEAERKDPPLLLDADTLMVRAEGVLVATLDRDNAVHLRKIAVGRDYGTTVEVLGGVAEGERVVVNPTDAVRDGARVKPVLIEAERQETSGQTAAKGR